MIDEDDADSVFISSYLAGGAIGAILLIAAIGIWLWALNNADKCSRQHCEHGKPALIKGACICVEEAKP